MVGRSDEISRWWTGPETGSLPWESVGLGKCAGVCRPLELMPSTHGLTSQPQTKASNYTSLVKSAHVHQYYPSTCYKAIFVRASVCLAVAFQVLNAPWVSAALHSFSAVPPVLPAPVGERPVNNQHLLSCTRRSPPWAAHTVPGAADQLTTPLYIKQGSKQGKH